MKLAKVFLCTLQFLLKCSMTAAHNAEFQKDLKHELDALLDEANYDVKQRPKCGGQPIDIAIGLEIEGIDKVSEVDMDYTLTFDLHHRWQDDRLILKNQNFSNINITLDNRVIQQVWVPDIYLSNDKKSYVHEITKNNRMLRLQPGGVVYYGLRITADLECKMNLAQYPLDEQICWMELGSYGYANNEIRLQLIDGKENSVHGIGNIKLAQFQLTDSNLMIEDKTFSRGEYSILVLSFTLQRNLGFFILQTYVPSSLLTILSWISFWINYKATSARFALGITSVLAITKISNNSRKSLPKIPDVKALDVYLIACFIFVFFGIMEFVFLNCVNYGNIKRSQEKKKRREKIKTVCKKKKPRKEGVRKQGNRDLADRKRMLRERTRRFWNAARQSAIGLVQIRIDDVGKIDEIARIGFPTVFILFNCFYWTYYNFF